MVEWSRTERNYLFDCLESEHNGMSYNFFIPFLSLFKKQYYVELNHIILY